MFLWLDSSSQEKVYFTSIIKDKINWKLILYLLSGEKVEEQFTSLAELEARIDQMLSDGVYVEVNSEYYDLRDVEKIYKTWKSGKFCISYLLKTGNRIVEEFVDENARDYKVDSLKAFNIPLNEDPSVASNYNDLDNKPSINGVELIGDVQSVELGFKTSELLNDAGFIKNDVSNLVNYYNRAYIDKILQERSGIPILEGTVDNPVLASDLETGVYVISGYVQASTENTNVTVVHKKVYSVWKDDDKALLWQEDPYVETKYYYLFELKGTERPSVGQSKGATEDFVKDYVANARIDGGIVE